MSLFPVFDHHSKESVGEHLCFFSTTAPLLIWSLVYLRHQTCRPSSTTAPPICRSPGRRSLLSPSTSLWAPTQVKTHQSVKEIQLRAKRITPPLLHRTGNPITAVYAISANRPGYSDYFVMSPPSSYRSPSWMSYPPEPEDLPRQWNDTPVSNTLLMMPQKHSEQRVKQVFFSPQNSRHLETICWSRSLPHQTFCSLVGPLISTPQTWSSNKLRHVLFMFYIYIDR